MNLRLVLAVVAGALVAAGCSQVEPMALDDYASTMTDETASYVLESQEISLRYQMAVEDQVEALTASGEAADLEGAMVIVRSETANFLSLLADAMERYHAAISALEPPEEVTESHDAYIEIIGSVRSTLPASRDALAETETFEDVLSSLFGSGFADGQQAWTAACETLEAAIRDAGRGANLKCVRESVAG